MAHMNVKIKHELVLDLEELVLICKALGGRLRDEDRPAALELGDSLSRLRASGVKSSLDANDKLVKNLDAKEHTGDRT